MARRFIIIVLKNKHSKYISAYIVKDCPDGKNLKRLVKDDLYRFLCLYAPSFSRYACSPRYYTYHFLCCMLINYGLHFNVRYRLKVIYK